MPSCKPLPAILTLYAKVSNYHYYHSVFGRCTFSTVKEYKLISKTSNADLNQRAILLIDTTKTRETRRDAFNPIKGRYTVYVFIAAFKGFSFNNTEKDFHDILVVKTDKRQRILAAYQYTLEWAEKPFTYDLYKATPKEVTLTNGLSLKKLRFRKVDYTIGVDSKLHEQGVLIL